MKYEIELHAQNLTGTIRQIIILDVPDSISLLPQIKAFLLAVGVAFDGQQVTIRLILPKANGLTYKNFDIERENIATLYQALAIHCKENT
jgi:hypothetical protein